MAATDTTVLQTTPLDGLLAETSTEDLLATRAPAPGEVTPLLRSPAGSLSSPPSSPSRPGFELEAVETLAQQQQEQEPCQPWYRPFYASSDWWSVWIGLAYFLPAVIVSFSTDLDAVALNDWKNNPTASWRPIERGLGTAIILLWAFVPAGLCHVVLNRTASAAKANEQIGLKPFLLGLGVVTMVALFARWVAQQTDISDAGLSYEVWALLVGILVANVFALPDWLKQAAKGEFYIKVGLVLLGLDMRTVGDLGGPGLMVSWLVTPIVVLIGYRLFAMKVLRMQDAPNLAIVLTCATSVCGASAATAIYGCVGGRKEVLTVAIAVVNLFTIPQMLALPYISSALGFDARVSGAWFGGSVDATGSVVAAGSVYDDLNNIDCDTEPACAVDTASTVKIIQNVIIGPIALVVTSYWLASQTDGEGGAVQRDSKLQQLWKRFPKFILGFLLVSTIITIVNATAEEDRQATLKALVSGSSKWWFALGFAGIGLTTNFRELAAPLRGGKPILLYLMVQTFDLLLTLAFAVLAFQVIA
eukprot:m.37665 g.37665  ORF g.37665 m.37665 type:complete len:531 (-) comp12530_c0_seq1:121-1713(-)